MEILKSRAPRPHLFVNVNRALSLPMGRIQRYASRSILDGSFELSISSNHLKDTTLVLYGRCRVPTRCPQFNGPVARAPANVWRCCGKCCAGPEYRTSDDQIPFNKIHVALQLRVIWSR
jgi:hypothetical protein